MARAMDCSVTATQRHLEQADQAMRDALHEQAEGAAGRVREFAMSLDVPEFFRAERKRRRQLRRALKWSAILIVALGLAALALWWTRPLTGT
jgi:hypothetical protein